MLAADRGCEDGGVPDQRRDPLDLPPGSPRVEWKPGLANEMMRELAPLLAEDGIDVDDIDVPDLPTMQAAMNRAVERLNMTRFTPVGHARTLAVAALHQTVRALAEQDTSSATRVMTEVQPESPDGTQATVSACIGICLGLLDEWLGGDDAAVPAGLAGRVKLPARQWLGQRAAADILALASKGRAFRSLDKLIVRQGGEHVLYGSTLALAAVIATWSKDTGTSVAQLLDDKIR